jgi:ubiquinone/menaquinone biosynthesis C-methylase UbiE
MSFDTTAVRHTYEELADGYAGRFGDDLEQSDVDRAVLDKAVALLERSARFIDLGCGPGQVASYLLRRGYQAVGVDLTPAMLSVARQLMPHLALVNGNVLQLPLRDGGVDGAVMWFSLHNLPRSLLGQALGEVRRVLRREGVFVMATHAGTGEETVEHDWHGSTEQVVITYYESDELRSAFDRHGLKIVDVRSRPPLEHEHAVTKLFVTAIAE